MAENIDSLIERSDFSNEMKSKILPIKEQLSKRIYIIIIQTTALRIRQIGLISNSEGFQTELLMPSANEEDITLSYLWNDKKKGFATAEFARCLSARLAEKVAIDIFNRIGKDVIDASIEQISKKPSSRWRYYDLLVDNYAVDVKNARKSFSFPETYSEHCVPHFKKTRNGDNVYIVGVLSDYIKHIDEFKNIQNYKCRFLGSTSLKNLQKLEKKYCDKKVLKLSFKRYQESIQYFLPPWVFSEPREFYKKSDRNYELIRNLPLESPIFESAVEADVLPIMVSAGHVHAKCFSKYRGQWFCDIIDKIAMIRVDENDKHSLPAIFLTILNDFLQKLKNQEEHEDYSPYLYNKILYFGGNYQFVAEVFDPIKTVYSLIRCLQQLWEGRNIEINRYECFRLNGGTVLSGKKEGSDQWDTLVSHCGGWVRNSQKCEKFPLIAGVQKRCPNCRHLVCDVPGCGFCSIKCAGHSGQLGYKSSLDD